MPVMQLVVNRGYSSNSMKPFISLSFNDDNIRSFCEDESIEVIMNSDEFLPDQNQDHSKQDSSSFSQEAAIEIQMSDDGIYCRCEKEAKVKFGTVKIRTYDLTIGDHPSCNDELPIMLDWTYNSRTIVEEAKGHDGSKDITRPQRLNYFQRISLLRDFCPAEVDKRVGSIDSLSLIDDEEPNLNDLLADDLDLDAEDVLDRTQELITDDFLSENKIHPLLEYPDQILNKISLERNRPFLISQAA